MYLCAAGVVHVCMVMGGAATAAAASTPLLTYTLRALVALQRALGGVRRTHLALRHNSRLTLGRSGARQQAWFRSTGLRCTVALQHMAGEAQARAWVVWALAWLGCTLMHCQAQGPATPVSHTLAIAT